jgi:hypothetical protein
MALIELVVSRRNDDAGRMCVSSAVIGRDLNPRLATVFTAEGFGFESAEGKILLSVHFRRIQPPKNKQNKLSGL